MHHLVDILLLGYVTTVAVIDGLRHRIPNALTVPAAAVGLVLGLTVHGVTGMIAAGEGLLVGLFLFLPLYLLGGFGAGDVKALAAAGSFLGPHGTLIATACTLIMGGIGGATVLLSVGGLAALSSMLRRWMFQACVVCSTGRSAGLRPDPDDAVRRRFPYGFAIAGGTAAALALGLVR